MSTQDHNTQVQHMPVYTPVEPTDITRCTDTCMHTASFEFYDGKKYVQERGLKQTTSFSDVRAGGHFIICCGDIMVRVEETDYPHITRRIL